MSRALAAACSLALVAGCYEPSPVDRGFQCTADNNFICPDGTTCDRTAGLCVLHLADMLPPPGDIALPQDGGVPPAPTCDDHVTQSGFTNLTNLGAVNTSADENELALTTDGTRIFFLSGGQLMTATIDNGNPKSASAPQAVSIANAPATFLGGSFNSDGSYWFAGNNGPGTPTGLYKASGSSLALLTATAQAQPTSPVDCPFFEPTFLNATTGELYVAFPLGGCAGPLYVARGASNKQIGAFYSAVPQSGLRAPSLLQGGLTMLMASTSSPRLFYAQRPTTDDTVGDTTWVGPTQLPMGAIGAPSVGDFQAIVSPDCKTLYLVANRAGGHGGSDLWAADIQQ